MSENVQPFKVLFILCIMILAISCNPQPKEIDLSFESIEQKDWSGSKHPYDNRDPGLAIISSTQEIVNVSDFVTDSITTKLEQINFDDNFVVFVFQGKKPSSGYEVNIARITQAGKTVYIYAQFNEPKPGDPKTDEVTSPYQVVQVKRNGGYWGQETTINLVVDNTVVTSLSYFIP